MKKVLNKKIAAVIVVVAAAVLIAVVICDGVGEIKDVSFSGYVMGSQITGSIYGASDSSVGEAVVSVIEKEENEYISKYKETSEIYKLNESGSGVLSEHTVKIIEQSLKLAEKSDGAFDVTVGALSQLWNFDNYTQTVPQTTEIQNALFTCDYEQIIIDESKVTLAEGQKIDLGAVGKGIACDDALEVLKKNDVTGAVISVGGTVLTYGENPDAEHWTVGIRSPEKDDSAVFMKLKIEGTAFVSTSGSYEKYFEKDGKLYHHILSTETGYPVENGLISVTVIADSGLCADALSTACFALGIENSLPLLEEYNADAVFVDSENRVYVTGNYIDKYEISDGYEDKYEEYSAVSAY